MRHLFELFIFFLILIVLPDWYIYRTYIRNYQQKWIRFVYAMPGILLLLGMLVIFSTFEPRPESMNRLSGFLILFLCICVPKAIFVCCILVFKALARIIHRSFHEIIAQVQHYVILFDDGLGYNFEKQILSSDYDSCPNLYL